MTSSPWGRYVAISLFTGNKISLLIARLYVASLALVVATRQTPSAPRSNRIIRASGHFVGGVTVSLNSTTSPTLNSRLACSYLLRCWACARNSRCHLLQKWFLIRMRRCDLEAGEQFSLDSVKGLAGEVKGAAIRKCPGVSATLSSSLELNTPSRREFKQEIRS